MLTKVSKNIKKENRKMTIDFIEENTKKYLIYQTIMVLFLIYFFAVG